MSDNKSQKSIRQLVDIKNPMMSMSGSESCFVEAVHHFGNIIEECGIITEFKARIEYGEYDAETGGIRCPSYYEWSDTNPEEDPDVSNRFMRILLGDALHHYIAHSYIITAVKFDIHYVIADHINITYDNTDGTDTGNNEEDYCG